MQQSSSFSSNKSFQNQPQGNLPSTNRNFDHLDYSENLYEFMKSQIPFYVTSSNQHINYYILKDRGLEKNDVLNIYYNDPIGKREFINDLVLNTITPKQWGSGDNQKELSSAQELGTILIDIQGSFSCYKFIEKIRHFYDQHQLYETVVNDGSVEQSKAETDDKHNFIKSTLQNLYIFNVFNAIEFNLTVRSLANFLKVHKNIGLIVIDGIHLIESVEIYSAKDKGDKYGSGFQKQRKTGNVMAMAQNEVPNSDDFFTHDQPAKSNASVNNSNQSIRQSFNLKRGGKSGQRMDFNHYDTKLIERAIALLEDYKKIYQFSVINCMAKPSLKRTADLLEQVMTRGLQPDQIPKQIPKDQTQQEGTQHENRLQGYMDIVVEGQVQGAEIDSTLRESIKALKENEILILRGDRQNSLMPRDPKKIHESLMSQHLSCCLFPQRFNDHMNLGYVNRYLGLYILYKININLYTTSDDVARSFYM